MAKTTSFWRLGPFSNIGFAYSGLSGTGLIRSWQKDLEKRGWSMVDSCFRYWKLTYHVQALPPPNTRGVLLHLHVTTRRPPVPWQHRWNSSWSCMMSMKKLVISCNFMRYGIQDMISLIAIHIHVRIHSAFPTKVTVHVLCVFIFCCSFEMFHCITTCHMFECWTIESILSRPYLSCFLLAWSVLHRGHSLFLHHRRIGFQLASCEA